MVATADQGAEIARRWAEDARWAGALRPYSAGDVVGLRGRYPVEHTLARLGAERLWELLLRSRARCRRSGPSPAARRCRWCAPGCRRSTSPAGRSRRTRIWPGRPIPTRASIPPNSVPALVRRLNNALLRADQIDAAEGRDDDRLARADRRRRRGRLRRRPQRLRADEGDDRGGRRRRALRGSARGREEVRPSRRQGARPDQPVRAHAGRRAARGRRARRADGARRAHRCAERDAPDERYRPGRPAVRHRRAHAARASSASATGSRRRSRARSPTRPTPTCSGSRPRRPDLGEAREFAAADPRARIPASCSPTTARRRSTGSATSTTRRSPASARRSAELGYRFQFITLAGFHSLNAAMFELARDFAAEGMPAYVRLQEREFELEQRRLHRDPPPARGRRRLLRPGRRDRQRRRLVDAGARGSTESRAVRSEAA